MELVSYGDKIIFKVFIGIIRNEIEKGRFILNNRCIRFLIFLFFELKLSYEF